MNDPEPPPVRGLVAGKYEIVTIIGRGGMGSVWEGRHASLGTRVAIKFIDQEYVGSREAQLRFATEARAAAAIQSKHAIQIFDHGVTDDGRPYIVMELLVGEPLDKRIERLGRISLQETARTIGQVCRALQRAHDAGIVHRDLKPENIFLVRSPDDDDEIAKVLDFGIAKIRAPAGGAIGSMGSLTSSTKTGAVIGTPYYMSPEQARGLRTIDHRSDLWSLGVIAYKCVTGILPFEGESVGDLLVKICTGPLPVPSVTLPGLPYTFDGWFFRALEREPANRFQSAQDLGEALAHAAGLSGRRPPDESTLGHAAFRPTVPLAPFAPLPTAGPAPTTTERPLPAAGITSSPFTASAVPARSSRGIWVVVAAAIIGGSAGVFGVAKWMAPSSDRAASSGGGTAADATPSAAAPSHATPGAAPPALPHPATTPPAAVLLSPAPTPSGPANGASAGPGPAAGPSPSPPHPPKPAAPPRPAAWPPPPPLQAAPAPAAPALPPSPPKPVRPPPSSADPGY